jgi:single-stranded-DNA-specific exonuclease
MEKRWKVLEADEEKIQILRSSINIHPALCNMLSQRGLDNFDKAKAYFRPSILDLHDPWKMKDMDKAVNRVLQALSSMKKFWFTAIMMLMAPLRLPACFIS